jgi:hypothetical protein
MSAAGGTFIPGVEERLPEGERVLWHGRPAAGAVARHVFHGRTLAAYFSVLVVVRIATVWGAPADLRREAGGLALFGVAAAVALGMFALVSRWVARSTVYAITDRRVVLKIGMAMPMTLNVPLACIESAGIREWRDGTGEIALALRGEDRFAYFLLWPHARPWRFTRPQPALRGLLATRAVGETLAAAVAQASGEPLFAPAAAAAGGRAGAPLGAPPALAGD